MADSYRQRYLRHKAAVDTTMGRPLGKWGKFKAFFSPNGSFSTERKAAIEGAEQAAYDAFPHTPQGISDRLYRPENIIGTTSVPGQQSTVYYRSQRSNSYGHITREHDIFANVGREAVRRDPTHTMTNDGPGGVLVEREGGVVKHTSRNPFVPITSEAQRTALSTAHTDHPTTKDYAAIRRELAARR